MWQLASLLLLFASLHENSGSFASKVIVLSDRCNTTGNSGDGDTTPSENCAETLTFALQNVTSHTSVILESEYYSINDFILIQDVTNFTLKAEIQAVTIHCTENTGLAFVNVSQLSIRNVIVDECGFTRTDIENTLGILKKIVNIFYAIPKVVQVAMLFGHCENVAMENVTIMNTRGFGLLVINVFGFSQFYGVHFFNNSNPGTCASLYPLEDFPSKSIDFDSHNRSGGAAVFMYFDYHNHALYHGSQFNLNLQNCIFTLNAECSETVFLNYRCVPGRGESRFITNTGYRLGGSGALSLVLAQLQYGIDIAVNDSILSVILEAEVELLSSCSLE